MSTAFDDLIDARRVYVVASANVDAAVRDLKARPWDEDLRRAVTRARQLKKLAKNAVERCELDIVRQHQTRMF